MNKILIIRVFFSLLILFCLFFTLPIVIACIFQETDMIDAFLIPALIIIIIGAPILFFTRKYRGTMNLKQGLLLVPLCWITVSIVGSIPYMLSGVFSNFSSALFETSSGLTTTGASVISNIEVIPKTMLFWRALTHWLGGMGIVVLAVALFPQVGIGGNILLAAESPGPSLEKITPKINSMAKIFWILYFSLTVLETLLLMAGGMDWFDSITHSFATLATGGFSTQNTSIFNYSPYIQIVITIFMVLAGINFAMYFAILSGSIAALWRDSELKVYVTIIIVAAFLVIINLFTFTSLSISESIRHGFFQVATILTTTGFSSIDYEMWPHFSQGVLFLLMFVGGCAGSTGGGIKVIRLTIILKYIRREIIKFFSPLRVQHITINRKVVGEDYIKLVMFFVSCYVGLLLLVTLIVSFDNHDILTSFSTALATLGNIGPGFSNIGPTDNYALFSPWVHMFLSVVMITGRLELFTVLILLSPRFWK